MTRARDVANIDGILTTTGDTFYASSGGTPARLGIGSTDQVLKVSGGVPAWATPVAGGMTLISTTTLSGANVTLSSIPSTYTNLYLIIYGMTNSTADGVLRIAPNAGTNLAMGSYLNDGTAGNFTGDYIKTILAQTRTNDSTAIALTLFNYAGDDWIPYILTGGVFASSNYHTQFVTGYTYSGGPNSISSLVISNSGGNWAGGTVKLYGVS